MMRPDDSSSRSRASAAHISGVLPTPYAMLVPICTRSVAAASVAIGIVAERL
jgi:hypothetical protein